MFDANALYKQRLSAHVKETSRYLRYIFNGHSTIALLFLVSALAFYYQQWLKHLPQDFPTAWVIGIVFGLIVTYSPVRTLLKEPDLVFLISAEHKMDAYFRNSLLYSFVMQLYVILLAAAAFGPLYFTGYSERNAADYFMMLAILLIFKVWNLLANWWMLKIRDPRTRQIDLTARMLINIAVFFFLIDGDRIMALIATLLFIIIFLYDLSVSRKQAGIIWDLLVEKDRHRMQTFYRIANMATDVPHLKNKVKRRRLIMSIMKQVPFKQKFTFDYLYRITFIRSADYLGMYTRLMVLGGVIIYFVPNGLFKVIFAWLFLYLASFQMMSLYQHHRTVIWLDLYPVSIQNRQDAVLKWLTILSVIQTAVYIVLLLFLGSYQYAGIMAAGGVLFVYVFINGYVKRKLV